MTNWQCVISMIAGICTFCSGVLVMEAGDTYYGVAFILISLGVFLTWLGATEIRV